MLGGLRSAEAGGDQVPHAHELGAVGGDDVDRGLEHELGARVRRRQRHEEVLECARGLSLDIAGGDNLPGGIERTRAAVNTSRASGAIAA